MEIGVAFGVIPAYRRYGQQLGLDWDGLSSVMHRHGVTAIGEFCDGIQHQVTTSTLFTGTRGKSYRRMDYIRIRIRNWKGATRRGWGHELNPIGSGLGLHWD